MIVQLEVRPPRRSTTSTPSRTSSASRCPPLVANHVRGRDRQADLDLPRRVGGRGGLVGYLIVSRYVDAWHVMNLVVATEHRRHGIATRLLAELFELTEGIGDAGTRSRFASRTRARSSSTRRWGSAPGRSPRLLHGQPGGCVIMWRDAVQSTSRRMILGLETSCDETAAAVVTRTATSVASVVASQADLHAPFGGVVPEIAATPISSSSRRSSRGSARGRASLDDIELRRASRTAPDWSARSRRAVGAPRRSPGPGAAARPRRPPARSRRLALPRPRAVEPPVRLPAGHRRTHDPARVDGAATTRVLGGTLDDAAGEAFDKGARLLGLGYPGGPRSTGSRRVGIPRRSRSPSRGSPGSTSRSPA